MILMRVIIGLQYENLSNFKDDDRKMPATR